MATPNPPGSSIPSADFDDEGDTQVHEAPFDEDERTQSSVIPGLPKILGEEGPTGSSEPGETLSEDE